MTDYDASSGRPDGEERAVESMLRAEAQLDHDYGESHDPLSGLDSESLATFNLRLIRKELGFSQQQIADKIAQERPGGMRLSQTQIAKIERGERPWRLNDLMMIADALGLHWDEFFRITPGVDYSDLKVKAARLRYNQARLLAEDAREEWRGAVRRQYEAEQDFLEVAARYGKKTELVMQALELRYYHQKWVADALEGELQNPQEDGRAEKAKEFAEAAWAQLLQEAKTDEADREGDPEGDK